MMKLVGGFVLHDAGGEHMAAATGRAAEIFNGLIRSNAAGSLIFARLMEGAAEEEIVEAVLEKYQAPRSRVAADVHRVIGELREAGLLDE